MQDGGVGIFNNPIWPGKWESQILWPHAETPDLVVSTGTGFARAPDCSGMVPFGTWLSNTTLARALRVLLSSANSEEIWMQFYNGLSSLDRQIYHRMNLPLDYLPPLDCSDAMDDLRGRARRHVANDAEAMAEVVAITNTLLTTQFFFELTGHPVFCEGNWQVSGTIRCRSPNAVAVVCRILDEYPNSVLVKDNNEILGALSLRDVCSCCILYKKSVEFLVRSLEQPVQIAFELRNGTGRSAMHAISALQIPRKIQWFIQQQLLDDPFAIAVPSRRECQGGRAGQGKRKDMDEGHNQKRKRRCTSLGQHGV